MGNFLGLGFSFYAEDKGLARTTDRVQRRVDGLRESINDVGNQSAAANVASNALMDDMGKGLNRVSSGFKRLGKSISDSGIKEAFQGFYKSYSFANLGRLADGLFSIAKGAGAANSSAEELALTFNENRYILSAALKTPLKDFNQLRKAVGDAAIFAGVSTKGTLDMANALIEAGYGIERVSKSVQDADTAIEDMGVLTFGTNLESVLGISNTDVAQFIAAGEAIGATSGDLTDFLNAGIGLQREFNVTGLLKEIPGLTSRVRSAAMRLGYGFQDTARTLVGATTIMATSIRDRLGGSMKEALGLAENFTTKMIDLQTSARDILAGRGDVSQLNELQELLVSGGMRGNLVFFLENIAESTEAQTMLVSALAASLDNATNASERYRREGQIRDTFGAEFLAALNSGGGPEALVDALNRANEAASSGAGNFDDYSTEVYKSVNQLRGVADAARDVAQSFLYFDVLLEDTQRGLGLIISFYMGVGNVLRELNDSLNTGQGGLVGFFATFVSGGKFGRAGVLGRLTEHLGKLDIHIESLSDLSPTFKRFVGQLSDLTGLTVPQASVLLVAPGALALLYGMFKLAAGTVAPAMTVVGGSVSIFGALAGAIMAPAMAMVTLIGRMLFMRTALRIMGVQMSGTAGTFGSFAKGLVRLVVLPFRLAAAVIASTKTAFEEFSAILDDPDLTGTRRHMSIVRAIASTLFAGLDAFFFGLPGFIVRTLRTSFTTGILHGELRVQAESIGNFLGEVIGNATVAVLAGVLAKKLVTSVIRATIMRHPAILTGMALLGFAAGRTFNDQFRRSTDDLYITLTSTGSGIIEGMLDAIDSAAKSTTGTGLFDFLGLDNAEEVTLIIRQAFVKLYYWFGQWLILIKDMFAANFGELGTDMARSIVRSLVSATRSIGEFFGASVLPEQLRGIADSGVDVIVNSVMHRAGFTNEGRAAARDRVRTSREALWGNGEFVSEEARALQADRDLVLRGMREQYERREREKALAAMSPEMRQASVALATVEEGISRGAATLDQLGAELIERRLDLDEWAIPSYGGLVPLPGTGDYDRYANSISAMGGRGAQLLEARDNVFRRAEFIRAEQARLAAEKSQLEERIGALRRAESQRGRGVVSRVTGMIGDPTAVAVPTMDDILGAENAARLREITSQGATAAEAAVTDIAQGTREFVSAVAQKLQVNIDLRNRLEIVPEELTRVIRLQSSDYEATTGEVR